MILLGYNLEGMLRVFFNFPTLNEISYEAPPDWNSEEIERRTSNVQHRTLNIDDASLYRFYNKRTAEFSIGWQAWNSKFAPDSSNRFGGVGLVSFFIDRIHYSMLDVRCSMFIFKLSLHMKLHVARMISYEIPRGRKANHRISHIEGPNHRQNSSNRYSSFKGLDFTNDLRWFNPGHFESTVCRGHDG
jgi:hypothetical protein